MLRQSQMRRAPSDYIDLKKLIEHGQAPALEIHAFEGIIYLVKIITDVGETLKKEDGNNQVFKSSTQAGIALAGVRW